MSKLSTVIAILLCAVFVQLVPTNAAYGGYSDTAWRWNCDTQPLVDFWGKEIEGSQMSGRGLVCATPLGLWSSLRVDGMTPGNAYTIWWVYIDDPANCADFPLPAPDVIPFPEPENYAGNCGLADFFTPDPSEAILNPLAVFGRMDSLIARRVRNNRFGGDLQSFVPSPGSQVWMFVFGHGPADVSDKRQLARQLLTPEDPGSGAPHLGIEGRPFGFPAAVVTFDIP